MAKSSNKPKNSPSAKTPPKAPNRAGILVAALVVVVVAAIAAYAWLRPRSEADVAAAKAKLTTEGTDVERIDPANEGHLIEVAGDLDVREPATDPQLGISAKAVMLLRYAEMLQWREQCGADKPADKDNTADTGKDKGKDKPKDKAKGKGKPAAEECTYDQVWSPQPISTEAFRVRKGHENPDRLPFGTGRFVARDIRLGAYRIDGAALGSYRLGPAMKLKAEPYAVKSADLPSNLEVSFRDANGALYAGDPEHPAVGDVRVSYRIIPAGKVAVAGTQHGDRLIVQRSSTVKPSS